MENDGITKHNEFVKIYIAYFPKMVRFAREYVISEEDAKNIVQDLFVYLWERRDTLDAISNMNAFLFTLVKNRCIDFYRQHTRFDTKKESLTDIHEKELALKMEALHQFDLNIFAAREIEEVLDKAINSLPEKCRVIFILSRMDGLKHEEIARQLDISVNTVQSHISTAIRKLRVELKDFLPLFLFII